MQPFLLWTRVLCNNLNIHRQLRLEVVGGCVDLHILSRIFFLSMQSAFYGYPIKSLKGFGRSESVTSGEGHVRYCTFLRRYVAILPFRRRKQYPGTASDFIWFCP